MARVGVTALLIVLVSMLAACSQSPQIVLDSSPFTRTPTVSATPAVVYVHVAGEVQRPGLYRLVAGSRVDDALKAAGGVTEEGSLDALNLAALLRDGEKITVPTKGQEAVSNPGAVIQVPNAISTSSNLKMNINLASAKELEDLPGIGEVLAQRIVDFRTKIGSFQQLEQLMEVAGIGQKRFEAIRDLITLD
jgi:competence protein ComEA